MPEKIGRTEAKAEIKKNLDELANRYESENIDPRIREVINDKDNLERLLSVLNNDGLLYLLNRCEEALDGTQYKCSEIFADFDEVFFEKCFPLSDTKDDKIKDSFTILCSKFTYDLLEEKLKANTKLPVKDRLYKLILEDSKQKNTYGLKVDSNNAQQEAFIKSLIGYKKYGKLIDDITAVADKQKFFEILYANRIVGDYNNFKRTETEEEKTKYLENNGIDVNTGKIKNLIQSDAKLTLESEDSEKEPMEWEKFVNVMSVFEKIFNWSSKKEQETQKKTLNKIIEFVHDNNTDSIDLFKRLCEADLLLDCFYDKYIQGLDSNGKISLPKYWRPNVRGNYKNEQAKEVWNNTKADCKILHYSEKEHFKNDLDYFCTLYKRDKAESYNFINGLNDGSKYSIIFDRESFEKGAALKDVVERFDESNKRSSNGMIFYSNVNMFEEAFSEKFLENEKGEIDTTKGDMLDDFLFNYISTYRETEGQKIKDDSALNKFNEEFSDANYKDKFEVIFDEKKFEFSKSKNKLDVAIQDSVMLQNKEDFTRHPDWDLGHLPGHEYKIMHLVYVLTDLFDPKFQENVIGKNKSYIKEKVLNKQEYGEQLKSLELIENELKNCHDENEKIRKRNEILKKQDEIIKKINKTESPKEEKQSKDNVEYSDIEKKKEELKKHLREIVKNTWLKYSSENDKDKIFLKILQDYKNYEAETSTFNQGHKGDTELSNKEIFEVILEIENEFKTGAIEWKNQ